MRAPLYLFCSHPEDAAVWLDPATPPEMAEEIVRVAAVGPDAFASHAVSPAVGNVRYQGPELARPAQP